MLISDVPKDQACTMEQIESSSFIFDVIFATMPDLKLGKDVQVSVGSREPGPTSL